MSDYPAHGSHCGARIFPLTCRFCGRDVFFFTCNHGSRVFFDELGPPWPQHWCFERPIALLGKPRVEQEIADRMMTPYMSVDYERYVRFARKRPKEQPKRDEKQLVALQPYPGAKTDEMGIIRELILKPNLLKKLRVEDTTLWREFLKDILTTPQAQVTIHTGALEDEDPYSITFLVKRKIIQDKALTIGDFVECTLEGQAVPGRDAVWVCKALKSAYD